MAELILEWQTEAGPREARIRGDVPAIIGRDRASAVQIETSLMVSRKHAEVRPNLDGFTIADLTNGRNPVLVNDRMITAETPLKAGDTITLGEVTLRVAAIRADAGMIDTVPVPDTLPPRESTPEGPSLHLRWTVQGKTYEKEIAAAVAVTIGRLLDNGVYVDADTVSRRHAQIAERGGQFYLSDLTSGRNAISVNQRQLTSERILNAGDVIRLGTVTLIVTAVHRPGTSGPSRPPGKGLVICPNCLREVDGSLEDCPWCGAVLVNAQTVI